MLGSEIGTVTQGCGNGGNLCGVEIKVQNITKLYVPWQKDIPVQFGENIYLQISSSWLYLYLYLAATTGQKWNDKIVFY